MANIPEAGVIVVLDTEPVEKAMFQFDNGSLLELRNELSQRNCYLAITDIQQHEIHAHLEEQTQQLKKLAASLQAGAGSRSIRKKSDVSAEGGVPLPRLLKHYKVKPVVESLSRAAEDIMKVYQQILEDSKFITISTADVSAGAVFPKYFANQPPFGAGRKKNEFPDAFSIEAIKNFAASRPDSQLVVISDDPDWISALEPEDGVFFAKTIQAAL